MNCLVFTLDGFRQVQAWSACSDIADRRTRIFTCDREWLQGYPAERVTVYDHNLRAERLRAT